MKTHSVNFQLIQGNKGRCLDAGRLNTKSFSENGLRFHFVIGR